MALASICSALLTKPYPRYSLHNMPQTSFTCRDKILGGYYADSETQCQMFHVCVKVAGVGVSNRSSKFLNTSIKSSLRFKIFDSSVPMVQLLIKKLKHVLIGEMLTATRQLFIMVVTTSICIESAQDLKVRKHQQEKTKTHSICNVLKRVSISIAIQ